MKRFYYNLCAAVALGAAAVTAVALDATPQPRERGERPARRAHVSDVPVLRINGGANGDKPLYGLCAASQYGGPLWGGGLAARIDANGDHVKLSDTDLSNVNGCYFNGSLLVVDESGSVAPWKVYDTTTWTLTQDLGSFVRSNEYVVPYAMTYDPTADKIYGYFYKDAAHSWSTKDATFCEVDLSNAFAPVKVIGESAVRLRCLAANAEGTLYGVAWDGNLYTVNKYNAELTLVAPVQFPALQDAGDPNDPSEYQGKESAIIDWETGDMYFCYADNNADTFIAKINTATGKAECVANFGYFSWGTENCEVFSALWFDQKAAAAASGTPAAVTDCTVEAQGVTLTAKVEFTLPAVDTDGAALSGNVDWKITDATNTLATGKGAAGSKVSTTVTVAKAGQYGIVVTAAQGAATSQAVSVNLFIGPDTPVIDASPVAIATGDGMKIAVAWHEPTGEHGGNLAQPLTFKVVRQPDGKTVAEAATGKQYVDVLDSDLKCTYTYEVTPKAGDVTGATYTSRPENGGVYFGIPHEYEFYRKQNEDIFNQYPTLNVNNDGQDWYLSQYGLTHPSAANSADTNDFLLIGPFKLEAGHLYNFSFVADNHSMTEQVAAYVGTDPGKAESFLANQLVEPTWIGTTNNGVKLSAKYTAPTTGAYYFAIHACSPSNRQNLYIRSVSVTTVDSNCPAAVADLKATPAKEGITLTFTLPSKTIGGKAAGVAAVNVYRKGDLAATLTEAVKDGGSITWTDSATPSGFTDYTVAAVNAAGEGVPSDATAWGGLDIPGTPRNFTIVEDINTPGLMHLKWDAPEVGTHGGWVDPENITYYVEWQSFRYGRSDEPVKVGSGVTSYDMQMGNVTAQDILSASVYGSNWAGEDRSSWNTKSGFYGPALPLPLRESWSGGSQKSGYWSYMSLVDKPGLFESWCDGNTGEATGKTPQDNDGYMMLFSTTVAGRGVRMRAPRVELGDAVNPTLVFYYLYTPDCLSYAVEIMVDDKPWTELKDLILPAANAGKWQRCEISLKEYVGKCKYLQIAFTAKAKVPAEEYAAFDNVSITDYVANDLMVTAFTAPTKADINTEAEFAVTVRNNGGSAVKAGDFTIDLFKNGVKVNTATGVNIAADATATCTLVDVPSVTDPVSAEYYAVINFAADQATDNNRSATRAVRLVTPDVPRVKDLKAEAVNGVTLTWSDPSTADMPDTPVTETWEKYTAFAISDLGEWTLRDGDQKPTVILELPLIGVLTYPNIGQPMAWQVMDPEAANIFNAAWYARSGKQFLVSFQACQEGGRNVASDDWLISPELNGKEQNISFYATASMSAYAPELLEIRYSTSGTATEDFKLLEKVNVPYMPDGWTEFSFRLPAGARHFAIVHKSVNMLAVLLDDLTYTPAGASPVTIQLQGFNVYRDGVRLNSELVTENEYDDTDAKPGTDHRYAVTAMWDKGESALSNIVVANAASISEAVEYQLVIEAIDGAIRISGGIGEPVHVYTVSGQLVASATAQDVITIPVPAAGIYLVRAGNTVSKIAVK